MKQSARQILLGVYALLSTIGIAVSIMLYQRSQYYPACTSEVGSYVLAARTDRDVAQLRVEIDVLSGAYPEMLVLVSPSQAPLPKEISYGWVRLADPSDLVEGSELCLPTHIVVIESQISDLTRRTESMLSAAFDPRGEPLTTLTYTLELSKDLVRRADNGSLGIVFVRKLTLRNVADVVYLPISRIEMRTRDWRHVSPPD